MKHQELKWKRKQAHLDLIETAISASTTTLTTAPTTTEKNRLCQTPIIIIYLFYHMFNVYYMFVLLLCVDLTECQMETA